MAQVNVIGRITADLELKTSEKSNPYVRFDIAENIGSRQALHWQPRSCVRKMPKQTTVVYACLIFWCLLYGHQSTPWCEHGYNSECPKRFLSFLIIFSNQKCFPN